MLKREHFPMRILGEFLEAIRKRKLGASLEAEEEIYMNEAAARFYREDFQRKIPEGTDRKRFQEENKISYEDNFSDLWKARGKIHKICLMEKKKKSTGSGNSFKKRRRQRRKRNGTDSGTLNFSRSTAERGNAVEILNRYLKIRRERSMSFGDGDNDVDMLKASGTGIAVRGGSRKLKECADAVCESPRMTAYTENWREGGFSPARMVQEKEERKKQRKEKRKSARGTSCRRRTAPQGSD